MRKWKKSPDTKLPTVPEVVEVIPGLLSTEDVARAIKRTKQTVTRYRRLKGLPYVRIVSSRQDDVRFREDQVAKWCVSSGIAFKPLLRSTLRKR